MKHPALILILAVSMSGCSFLMDSYRTGTSVRLPVASSSYEHTNDDGDRVVTTCTTYQYAVSKRYETECREVVHD